MSNRSKKKKVRLSTCSNCFLILGKKELKSSKCRKCGTLVPKLESATIKRVNKMEKTSVTHFAKDIDTNDIYLVLNNKKIYSTSDDILDLRCQYPQKQQDLNCAYIRVNKGSVVIIAFPLNYLTSTRFSQEDIDTIQKYISWTENKENTKPSIIPTKEALEAALAQIENAANWSGKPPVPSVLLFPGNNDISAKKRSTYEDWLIKYNHNCTEDSTSPYGCCDYVRKYNQAQLVTT